jgi:two-component system, NarL family, nitrate/nitrite response regulator NarL
MIDPINLVLADDHQIVIDGLLFMLSSEKKINPVYTANNTNDVLAYLKTNYTAVQFLITDINMPTISGIELCRQVKQLYPSIKVLFLSMYSSKEMIREAMLAEADGYMLKNGGKDKLIEAIFKISNDGTYYSEEIIPIIYSQIEKEKRQQEKISLLSDREKEVLVLIAREFSSEEIAEKLFLSVKTIGYHRQNLLQKCDCKSLVGLVKYAIKYGLVEA